jgi:FAD/FMN-containing dehydrogenase/ferredoxin
MILETAYEVKLYAREAVELPEILTKLFPRAQSVFIPENIEELPGIISQARKDRLGVIPRGAATSGMGGLTPLKKSVILDLTHLDRIVDFDEKKKIISFESGLRWWSLKRFLNRRSFDLYTYPTSLFSTVGGWLSTGGYGINSYRHGHVSEMVESIDVLTSGGTRTIGRSDPDFRYFLGTEGQMGVISRVRLKVRELTSPKSHLVFFETLTEAASFIDALTKSSSVQPAHIAFFDRQRLEHKSSFLSGKISFPPKEGVLVSFNPPSDEAAFLDLVERKRGSLAEGYLSSFLWNERFFPFSIRRFYPSILGCETVLPVGRLPLYINQTRRFGENYGLSLSTEATFISPSMAVAYTVFPSDYRDSSHIFHLFLSYSLAHIASQCGGSPYGIGIWNLPLLGKIFSREDLRPYRMFKKESDPASLFNPGKAFSGGLIVKSFLKLGYLMSGFFSNGNVPSKALGIALKVLPQNGHGNLSEIEACVNCGACTVVCPSYLVQKTEAVTAKGKLFFYKNFQTGSSVSRELVEQIFLCLHCHLCEYVCQSKLKLVPVWDRLEALLEKEFGRPKEKIDEFVKLAESNPAYSELLDFWSLPAHSDQANSPHV